MQWENYSSFSSFYIFYFWLVFFFYRFKRVHAYVLISFDKNLLIFERRPGALFFVSFRLDIIAHYVAASILALSIDNMIHTSLDTCLLILYIAIASGFLPFFFFLSRYTRRDVQRKRDDAGSKDEVVEGAGGTGHCMLVTSKFHPRTTFPKSATGKRENGREE